MRRVFIHKGQAYVPMKEQFSLVMAEFQSRLLKGLEVRPPTTRGASDDA